MIATTTCKHSVRPTVVAALIAVCIVYVSGADNPYTAPPNKDPKCHQPITIKCNASTVPSSGQEIIGWFYHAPFKSCRPLYSFQGKNNCIENSDIPLTKRECEDLCSEPCTVVHGINDTEPGICMFEEYCKIKTSVIATPRPCHAYNVKCCPRDYEVPIVPLTAAIPATAAEKRTSSLDAKNGLGFGIGESQRKQLLGRFQYQHINP